LLAAAAEPAVSLLAAVSAPCRVDPPQPARNIPADAAIIVRPKSRRENPFGLTCLITPDPQVLHADEVQLPQISLLLRAGMVDFFIIDFPVSCIIYDRTFEETYT
jgi:hypothetical protein